SRGLEAGRWRSWGQWSRRRHLVAVCQPEPSPPRGQGSPEGPRASPGFRAPHCLWLGPLCAVGSQASPCHQPPPGALYQLTWECPWEEGGQWPEGRLRHLARAPVGSTALPGLIPDLVARIPCEFWDLWKGSGDGLAGRVAAAVHGRLSGPSLCSPRPASRAPLGAHSHCGRGGRPRCVSCLLCACCCCRGRHRKEPRDEEAVGLGSARGTINMHLWECLQLSVEYDFGSQEIKVGLRQAADLRPRGPGGTADPYARVSLSPEAGCRHETKVHRGTLCPTFEETCSFHVPPVELPQAALRVQILDYKLFSQHELLGALSLPLGTVDPQPVLELWHPLGPPSTASPALPGPEQLGEVCFSLQYVPGSGRLTVVVLEARGLSPPYVKVQLVLNQRKWKKRKTSARKGMATPYFNETFTFLVPFSQIQSVALVLAVWAWGPQFQAKPVSKVLLGARASALRRHAGPCLSTQHRLQPAREVDRALALQPHLRLPLAGS
ncbi:hypothetical protein EI555_021367, partial [Monodon monoceros]